MFEFIADRVVLDFLPTLAARGTAEQEQLRTPGDLADWLVQSRLLDLEPTVGTDDLERAKALREALFRLVAALIDDTRPTPRDRRAVNAAAAVPLPTLTLTDDGLRRSGNVDSALAALARDGLELWSSPDRALLQWCADPICTRPFIDRSRGHRRRWCGMRGCGDRAKAAAYRARLRTNHRA